jgi:hypothetical protein
VVSGIGPSAEQALSRHAQAYRQVVD